MQVRDVQMLLASANYYSGAIDGDAGPLTMRGVEIVERNGNFDWRGWPQSRRLVAAGQRILQAQGFPVGPIDGWAGRLTNDALTAWHTKRETGKDWIIDRVPGPDHSPTPVQHRWPQQAAATMRAFYGQEGGPDAWAGIVSLPFPFPLAWQLGTRVSTVRCHQRLAGPFTSIWAAAARHYGEAEFRRLRLDLFGGVFNHRTMRGGTALSTHSWGAAWDVDPERNQLHWGRDRAQLAHPDYLPFWRIVENEGAVSLGRAANRDWMHFQFARL
jgi:hypothetical protein